MPGQHGAGRMLRGAGSGMGMQGQRPTPDSNFLSAEESDFGADANSTIARMKHAGTPSSRRVKQAINAASTKLMGRPVFAGDISFGFGVDKGATQRTIAGMRHASTSSSGSGAGGLLTAPAGPSPFSNLGAFLQQSLARAKQNLSARSFFAGDADGDAEPLWDHPSSSDLVPGSTGVQAGDIGVAPEGSMDPTYGAGDVGSQFVDTIDALGQARDPFALATFDDPKVIEGIDYAPFDMDPIVVDHYDPPMRKPTLRNPVIAFGADTFGFTDDFYSGFGVAAVVAGEGSVVGCEMGCAVPTKLGG